MRSHAFLLVFLAVSATVAVPARTVFADRATTIAQDLQLPPDAAARIASSLASYDADLYRLHSERGELHRQFLSPHTDGMSQKLLDDMVANERAAVQLDETLLATLRPYLAPDQIVHVFMMLTASEPEPPRALAQPALPSASTPSSPSRKQRGCNPFEQMHHCPN